MSNIKYVLRYCSPEVKYLMISCRPHYLPREFSSVLFVAIYLPPQHEAGTKTALHQLYKAISKEENTHPEAALLVARDFNEGKLKSVLPHFYQHVTCATREEKILDHLYSTHRDAYKALPRPPFGKSDHNSILLIPAYINMCIDDIVPTVTIRTYPNQKPLITGNICTDFKAIATAFKERETNLDAYKKSRYALRQIIKQAKGKYRIKTNSYYTGSDARRIWQGLQTITDYKGKPSHELPSDESLPNKLNAMHASFEASKTEPCVRAPAVPDN